MSEVAYIEFDDKEVRDFLKNIDANLKNIKDGQKQYTGLLSAIVYGDVIDHFQKQKGEDGPWKKWSESYKKKMEEEGKGNNKILQDTGRLRNNFKPQNVKRNALGFLWFNDATTKDGFPYAFAHQEGGPKLPKRDFMWLSDKAVDKIAQQTLKFLVEKGL